jgi:hypothetical protein
MLGMLWQRSCVRDKIQLGREIPNAMNDPGKPLSISDAMRRLIASSPPPPARSVAAEIGSNMLSSLAASDDRKLTPPPYFAGLVAGPGPPRSLANLFANPYTASPPSPPPSINLFANPYIAPPPRTYSLFVSHAWRYSDEYRRFVALLKQQGFSWKNLSVPQTDPIAPNPALKRSIRRLMRELEARISESDCLLVLSGMYCAHSDWIQSEIEAAQDHGKPIIAVVPFGQERVPQEVQNAADDNIVGWRAEKIVEAVRRLVR